MPTIYANLQETLMAVLIGKLSNRVELNTAKSYIIQLNLRW